MEPTSDPESKAKATEEEIETTESKAIATEEPEPAELGAKATEEPERETTESQA